MAVRPRLHLPNQAVTQGCTGTDRLHKPPRRARNGAYIPTSLPSSRARVTIPQAGRSFYRVGHRAPQRLEEMGNTSMNLSLTRILAGLALASSVVATTGIGTGGTSAHARAGGGLPCTQVQCWVVPSLTVSGGHGSLYIQGAHFAANHGIELNIYAPVSSPLPPLTKMYAVTDTNGSFLQVYTACSNYVMEVQAIDT